MDLSSSCGSVRAQKWVSIVGIAIICAPNGVAMFYGNLLTYTDSYVLDRGVDDVSYISATVLSGWAITFAVSLTFSDKVTRRLPKSGRLLLGIFFYDASYLMGYWTVRASPILFICVNGLLTGLANGQILALASLYLLEWTAGKNLGIISSMATTTSLGSLLVNQLITVYVNPDNTPPDLSRDRTKYFQQEKVLTRVPSVFLVLSGTFLAVHLFGFALLKEAPRLGEKTSGDKQTTQNTESDVAASAALTDGGSGANGFEPRPGASASQHQNARLENYEAYVTMPGIPSDEEDATVPLLRDKGGPGRNRATGVLRETVDALVQNTNSTITTETDCCINCDNVDEVDDCNCSMSTDVTANKTLHNHQFHEISTKVRVVAGRGLFSVHVPSEITLMNNELSINCGDGEMGDTEVPTLPDGNQIENCPEQNSASEQEEDFRDDRSEIITDNSPNASSGTSSFSYEAKDKTIKQILMSKEFYMLWFGTACAEFSFLVISTFYKSFGQSVIQNDHFLGEVGTLRCGLTFIARIGWGIVVDKTGVKNSLVIFFSLTSLFSVFYVYTPYISPWLYLFWSCMLASISSGLFTINYVASYVHFGAANFITTFGLILTSSIVASLILPSASSALLEQYSWTGLFYSTAFINFLPFVIVIGFFSRGK